MFEMSSRYDSISISLQLFFILPEACSSFENSNCPLTGFASTALPCDQDALVLVLIPQRTVGFICQSVAGEKKRK